MEKFLTANIARKTLLTSLLTKKHIYSWRGKPASWPDIRKSTQDGHIYLLCDIRYPIGFTATATDGYIVNIDGEFYGSYNSTAQFSMADWSDYTNTTGYVIDCPEGATKAHIIDIFPQTSGNNITAFRCARVAASGNERQGILWAHFNLTNVIRISNLFAAENTFRNTLVKALTSKNNLITFQVTSINNSGLSCAFPYCAALEYLPILKASSSEYSIWPYIPFLGVSAKKIVIKNNSGKEDFAILNQTQIEEINIENGLTLSSNIYQYTDAHGATKLKKFPKINQNKGENFIMYNCPVLEPVNIDDRFNDIRKLFRFYGTSSVPTPALKSLRVSNQAPFDGAAPQIKVDYTDLDRSALVQLFNDLPTVSSGQIISIVGATGASDLTAEEALIPDSKGWTLTR